MARSIDHLVLAVRDLDAAAASYERLGFQVGARNRHATGTENRLVQFPNAFLELVGVGAGATIAPSRPGEFSFSAFIASYLEEREGFAMLVLRSADAAADAAEFAAADIGHFKPLTFSRKGRRPDGSETEVSFSLAFAVDERAPEAGFFTCQHHRPENLWFPTFQQHRNAALALSSVAMVAENPTDHHIFFSAFTGERELHASSLGISIRLPRGHIDVLTPAAARDRYGVDGGTEARLIGFSVTIPDVERQQRQLAQSGVPCAIVAARLVVPPKVAHGVAVAFERRP